MTIVHNILIYNINLMKTIITKKFFKMQKKSSSKTIITDILHEKLDKQLIKIY